MLDKMKSSKKDTGNQSSQELLKARGTTNKETGGKAGRPSKYPRTPETKRMNIFIPGDLHKELLFASATIDNHPSMNEIIVDILYATLEKYPESIK